MYAGNNNGRAFIIGLVVFYLSAGFFSVFFTTAFVNLSFEMKTPELWAGMGRATNNLCAALMGTVFFSLFNSTNMLSNSIVIIILFVIGVVLTNFYDELLIFYLDQLYESEIVRNTSYPELCMRIRF